jgi:hypothetical protein
MRSLTYLGIALLAGASACNAINPVTPGPEPAAATMQFKTGARYQFESYHTDAQTNTKDNTTATTRTWAMVNPSATAYGRSNVAIYVDSVLSAGGIFTVADSIYMQQESGTNNIYRYASLAPELDISGVPLLDIGKEWMHEGKLNATTAQWFVADAADTLPNTYGLPQVSGIRISVTDSAVASAIENLTIDGQTYSTTKTTHDLVFKVSVLGTVGGFTIPVDVGSKTIVRTTWMAPTLGAIVREERPGAVISASYNGQGFTVPVPGYYSSMIKVLATGQ